MLFRKTEKQNFFIFRVFATSNQKFLNLTKYNLTTNVYVLLLWFYCKIFDNFFVAFLISFIWIFSKNCLFVFASYWVVGLACQCNTCGLTIRAKMWQELLL